METRAPSKKRLMAELGLTPEQAKEVRALVRDVSSASALEQRIEENHPDTHAYARSCYNDPYNSRMWRWTMALHAIDRLIGTYGVECERDENGNWTREFCNTGDSYGITLYRCKGSDTLNLGCMHPY